MKPFAATNEPGTCLWCGGKCREAFNGWPHFCTLSCAAEFGKVQAQAGKRLQPVQRVEPKVAP